MKIGQHFEKLCVREEEGEQRDSDYILIIFQGPNIRILIAFYVSDNLWLNTKAVYNGLKLLKHLLLTGQHGRKRIYYILLNSSCHGDM